MKGITHFMTGVAAASCFPGAVKAGAAGDPLYFILGGVAGLLPDTLDFKFCRFFYPCEVNIVPDPLEPDPQMIADGVARAVQMAYTSGNAVRVKLNTIQLGPGRWQRYYVRFNIAERKVEVAMGPVVEFGGSDDDAEKDRLLEEPGGSAGLVCGIKLEYQAVTTVDIFDGPVFRMVCTADGRKVVPQFIPWHRWWTHSFVIGLLLALAGAVIFDVLAGLVIMCAYSAHIIADQLGYMGSNLFFPFTKRRASGKMMTHSGDARWNFMLVWASCLIVLWNLYSAEPWRVNGLTLPVIILYGMILPIGLLLLIKKYKLSGNTHKV